MAAFLGSDLLLVPVLDFLPIVLIGSRFGLSLMLLLVDGVELFSPSVIFSVSKESFGCNVLDRDEDGLCDAVFPISDFKETLCALLGMATLLLRAP